MRLTVAPGANAVANGTSPVKRRGFAVAVALAALAVCASAPAAAPGDSLLALQRVGGWVVLERLDPPTLRPLAGAPRPLRVDRRFPVTWDFSPDGSHLVIGGGAARLVDVRTFREVVDDWPFDPPASVLRTTQGVQWLDGIDLFNLNGADTSFDGPVLASLVDFAKGSAGLVELWELWDRPGGTSSAGHWWVGANDGGPDVAVPQHNDGGPDVAVPQLDGQPGVAFAVDGDRAHLLSPAGALAVVSLHVVVSSATVALPQPAAATGSPLRIVVWHRDELVAMTPGGLVLVDAADGSAHALGPSATDVVPVGRWLVSWRAGSRDGVDVYGERAGSERLLFHLLTGASVSGVAVHGTSAYVCVGRLQPCTGKTAIVDLRTGRELGRVTAPVVLLR
jgi:hypothetical protein